MSSITRENGVIVKSTPNENFLNHISHIQNIPNPKQIQYMSFSHSLAWSFSKEKKCKKNKNIIYNLP